MSSEYLVKFQSSQMHVLITHQEHSCIEKWVEISYETHSMYLVSRLQISLQSSSLHHPTGAANLGPGLTDGLVALPVGIEAVLGAVDHGSAPGTLVCLVGVFDTTVTQERVREELVQPAANVLVSPHLHTDRSSQTFFSVATADQSVVVDDWFVWKSHMVEATRVLFTGTKPGKALELNLILSFPSSESSLTSKAFSRIWKTAKHLEWVGP